MKKLNKLKYDKVNILAKCTTEQTFMADMQYNATITDRAIQGNMIRFIDFWFNPSKSDYGSEEVYSNILNRITEKNSYIKEFKVKSLEVNFDYKTELGFDSLQLLGKIITNTLAKRGYKTLNINADIAGFDYKYDEFTNRYRSYKWYRQKGKNKFLEVKLYRKAESINRFEIIFYNVDCRHFKILNESYISSGHKITKTFKQIYDDIYELLEQDQELWNDEGIAEFMNSFRLMLDELEIEQVA